MSSTSETRAVGVALAQLLVAMASVQFGASFAKALFPAAGPTGAVALRLIFSTPILWLALRPWRRWPERRALPVLAAYGAVLGTMNATFYLALQRLPLGVAVGVEFTGPLLLALAASRRPSDLLWVALAALGLAGLAPVAGARLDPVGLALALAAGGCWALYIVFGKRSSDAYGPPSVAIGSLVAALLVAPFGLAQAGPALLDARVLGAGLMVAVLSSAVPYGLEMLAMAKLPTRTFSTLMSLEPALAALAGFFVLGEHLTGREWVSIAAIMVASAGVAWSARRDSALAARD